MKPVPLDFPGGATAEAMPDGRWICDDADSTRPIRTSWGEVSAPANGAYTTRLDPVAGSHRICGHEAVGTYVILHDTTTNQWKRVESTPVGGYSSAFGPDGTLYWIGASWEIVKTDDGQVPGATGYLGLRQILPGPTVVNMQSTYARADGMYEYTTVGDVTVGHGGGVQEGVIIDYEGKRYQLDTGQTSEVRFNRDGDKLAIAWRKVTEHRARIAMFTLADLADVPLAKTEPDLPPIESIPLIHRTFGVCCYSFNDAVSPGQLILPVRPSQTQWGKPIILPSDRPDLAEGNLVWAVYAGENPGLTYETAIAQARPVGDALQRGLLGYKDSYPLPASGQLKPYDIAGCLLKRGASESIVDFKSRCRGETGEWPTVHLGDIPSRSCETFQAACEVANEGRWTGFSLFAAGRSDVPWDSLKPRIERFMSGITGTPKIRIIPQTQGDAMPYAVLKKQTPGEPVVSVVKVTEEQRDGKLYLNKPDGRKISMQPDGTIQDRNHDNYGPWEEWIKTSKGYVCAAHDEQFGIVTL